MTAADPATQADALREISETLTRSMEKSLPAIAESALDGAKQLVSVAEVCVRTASMPRAIRDRVLQAGEGIEIAAQAVAGIEAEGKRG